MNILLPKETEGKLELISFTMTTLVTSRVRALRRSSKVWFKTYSWMRGKETNYQGMVVIIKTML